MPNMIVSYDLNGPNPDHAEVDKVMKRIGARWARVLETVWWIEYQGSASQLRDAIKPHLSGSDRLFVAECSAAAWHNVLVNGELLAAAWKEAA